MTDMQQSPHLVPLPQGTWAVWRWVGLRGAGFPADGVLRLADTACAAAVDQLLSQEERAVRAQDDMVKSLYQVLNQRRRDMKQASHQDAYRLLAREARYIERTTQRIRSGYVPAAEDVPWIPAVLAQAYQEAIRQLESSEAQFSKMFQLALINLSKEIRQIIQDAHFCEAVVWQNRCVLQTAFSPLLKTDPNKQTTKDRSREELVASYWQRYCVKNDSIGFFGPFGWAQIGNQEQAVVIKPGPNLLAHRTVYFEEWGISVLAAAIAQNEQLKPWFVPRPMPFLHLEGTTLYLPASHPIELPAPYAAVLQACDGERTAWEIAHYLLPTPFLALKRPEEVYEILNRLADAKRIVWTLEIPTEGLHPEQHLRQRLEKIGDIEWRQLTLHMLSQLEAKRDRVGQVAGQAEQLEEALADLEELFGQLTDSATVRRTGEVYAARTLIYEDCRRDVEVQLGTDFLQALGPPLSILLHSARWFTFELAAVYRQAFEKTFADIYSQLGRTENSCRVVDFANFWLCIYPLLFGDGPRPLDKVTTLFQERWAQIFSLPEGERLASYTTQALESSVLSAFQAPKPGWLSACHQSPDIMIAASGPEAIRRGDYYFVLGELHMGINAFTSACFLAQHPSPEELVQAYENDVPEPRIIPMPSREWTGQVSRTQFVMMSPEDIRLVIAHDTCLIPGTQRLSIGELIITEQQGELLVRTRDGQQTFDLIEICSEFLVYLALNSFRLMPDSHYTPRIIIDRLVVARETWRFTPDELPFVDEKEWANQLIEVRRWMRVYSLPRWVFVKLPGEKKPFYVDFDSPIYVKTLVKLIRKVIKHYPADTVVTVTEMLPTHEQAWLMDATGQHYTSELRIVAVDRAAQTSLFSEVNSCLDNLVEKDYPRI